MAHTVTLITHPNQLGPEEPIGYRFAVHVTPADDLRPIDPADLGSCVNAAWRPTLELAELDGVDLGVCTVGGHRIHDDRDAGHGRGVLPLQERLAAPPVRAYDVGLGVSATGPDTGADETVG